MYVVTVRKNNQQWQVFRRYKEWEDLRTRLCQFCGGAPQMPGKMLFGRMRPEVRGATGGRVGALGLTKCHAVPGGRVVCPWSKALPLALCR